LDVEKLRVTREMARWTCDPEALGFDSTDELQPIDSFIGQRRAVKALEFGLGLDSPGYNIFVTGLTGTGKSTVIRTHLAGAVSNGQGSRSAHEAFDWCYVYNFDHPDQPAALKFPAGDGRKFTDAVDELRNTLNRELPEAFDDDAYKVEIRRINEHAFEQRNERITEADRVAREQSFSVHFGPAGIAVVPMQGDEPMDQAAFSDMPEEEQERVNEARRRILSALDQTMDELRTIEESRVKAVNEVDRQVVANVVKTPFEAIDEQFGKTDEAKSFLGSLLVHTLENISSFRSDDSDSQGMLSLQLSMPASQIQRDPMLPFKVNLFVDNANVSEQQIVVEENPTYAHLFGRIERPPTLEARPTDHTMLKAGSLVRASGGYLVLEARDVLTQPAVWPALKRVLREREIRPEDPADIFAPGFFSQALRPAAIPIDVKVVMSGEPELYSALARFDPDFWQVFKVRADLDSQTDITPERLREYSRFVSSMCSDASLSPFSSGGVSAVIEHSARMVDSQTKLSTRFGLLADLVVEAAEQAAVAGSKTVEASHVRTALEGRIERSARIADAIREMMLEGTLIVDLDGEQIGQVNGLSVYGDGDVVFGRPSKITARSFMGMQGVVNVEREVELTGQTHDKGVLILSGYIGANFAVDTPLSVNISIVFEQSYGMIDGDSASSTELYAILSSLAGLPIKQNIAVTGSINQFGDIQPIGGVNEKIEGFFDLCSAAGKLNGAGVIIPARNMSNLMLRSDVVEAIDAGTFSIYAVEHINQGIEVLTGVGAGERDATGEFPENTVNGMVRNRLREFAVGLRDFGSAKNGNSNGSD